MGLEGDGSLTIARATAEVAGARSSASMFSSRRSAARYLLNSKGCSKGAQVGSKPFFGTQESEAHVRAKRPRARSHRACGDGCRDRIGKCGYKGCCRQHKEAHQHGGLSISEATFGLGRGDLVVIIKLLLS